ncbi:hypothetical protein HanPI659440_Chr13g0506411 [Helianthus annuus]|nr:hypothetical protein HanPI659440_Chr13g0506411 [Helianthus annuus]
MLYLFNNVLFNLPNNAECTSKRRMSSRLNKTQDVKKKGKVTSERKEVVKNRTKGNAALPVDTSDYTGCSSSVNKVKGKRAANVQKKLNRRNKIAKTAKKHSGHPLDPEFFHFDRKGDYRLVYHFL